MTGSGAGRPRRKRAGEYHHGDLRQALIAEAVRRIDRHGVESLTLRTVGDALGVSRTALYRHFSDKQALLAAVAREGFRTFRLSLADAWQSHGRGTPGFEAMGRAYIGFAVAHPAHYRVMFGRFLESCMKDPELVPEATAAFQVLVDALVELQRTETVRADEARTMGLFIWSIMHGIAMLTIDGQLGRDGAAAGALEQYALERIRAAISGR